MQVFRLYEPGRRPWTELIAPHQFVVFVTHADSGRGCDADGRAFASDADATCLLFDGFDEAKDWCIAQVERYPNLRFEVFDSSGRAHSPLLIVVDRTRAHTLAANPRTLRRRKAIALALALGAIPLIAIDYQMRGAIILPTLLGLNMLLAAGRLLQLNMAEREAERNRVERLLEVSPGGGDQEI